MSTYKIDLTVFKSHENDSKMFSRDFFSLQFVGLALIISGVNSNMRPRSKFKWGKINILPAKRKMLIFYGKWNKYRFLYGFALTWRRSIFLLLLLPCNSVCFSVCVFNRGRERENTKKFRYNACDRAHNFASNTIKLQYHCFAPNNTGTIYN